MTEDELKAQTVSELSDMALEDSDECTDDYQDSDDDIYEIDMYGDVWRFMWWIQIIQSDRIIFFVWTPYL